MKKKLILNKFSLRYLESFDVLSPYERAHRLGGPETMKNCKRNSIFSDFFSQNSNRKMLDHNFSRSTRIEPSFGTVAKLNELNNFYLDRFEGCLIKNARF